MLRLLDFPQRIDANDWNFHASLTAVSQRDGLFSRRFRLSCEAVDYSRTRGWDEEGSYLSCWPRLCVLTPPLLMSGAPPALGSRRHWSTPRAPPCATLLPRIAWYLKMAVFSLTMVTCHHHLFMSESRLAMIWIMQDVSPRKVQKSLESSRANGASASPWTY